MSPSQTLDATAAGLPESRVLIIGTGGTICMQEGPDGLAPSEDFLETAMAPRPSFNDMSGLDGSFSTVPCPCVALFSKPSIPSDDLAHIYVFILLKKDDSCHNMTRY